MYKLEFLFYTLSPLIIFIPLYIRWKEKRENKNVLGDLLKENKMLYLNMFIGEVGSVLILFCAVKAILNESDASQFFILFTGFILSTMYTNYLERIVGLSKKILWVRFIVFIILLLIIGYIYFS